MDTPEEKIIESFNELIQRHYPDAKISVRPIRCGRTQLTVSSERPPEIVLGINIKRFSK